MEQTIQKQIADTRHALQTALDCGDNREADRLMIEVKTLQQQEQASMHSPVATMSKTTRAAAKGPPPIERAAPLWRMLTVKVISALERRAIADVMGARYGGLTRKDADRLDAVMKAAQDPAMTNVSGWAQELTREVQAAYLEELAKASIFAALPLVTENFNGATSITVPTRDTSNSNPNLAAGWRKEGAPIRVGALALKGVKLVPYAPAVIGTFSEELAKRSTPRIEQIIRGAVLGDSAEMFDTKFLSSDAAVPDVSPAGILAGLPPGNTFASTGATPAQIAADMKRAVGLLLKAGLSAEGFAWAMSPFNAMALQLLITATGSLQFPEMASGRLLGLPLAISGNVPDTSVFLLDGNSIARALPSPSFDASTEATIHEEDTTPLPIVDDGTTPVIAHPVRSLYQTYSCALRAVYADLSWGALRPGAVVHITDIAW